MASHKDISRRVMETVTRSPWCHVDQVLLEYPDFSWNHIVLERDRLNRAGRMTLRQTGPGMYPVTPRTEPKVQPVTTFHIKHERGGF